MRLFSFGGYGLALAALALVVFGAIECPPIEAKVGSRQVRVRYRVLDGGIRQGRVEKGLGSLGGVVTANTRI